MLVFASPATPIADVHLGHLAGPYLAADAFTRYQRMRGRGVSFIAFTRDHDQRVVRRAELLGLSPANVVMIFSGRITDSLSAAGIEPDAFVTPSFSNLYTTQLRALFTELWKRGRLTVKEAPVFYCPACKQDPVICSHCSGDYRGDVCHQCGRPRFVDESPQPRCPHCSGPMMVSRRRPRLVIDLNTVRSKLADYHSTPRLDFRPRQLVEEILASELGDFPLDAAGNWGIEVSLAGLQSFMLDTAAELAGGYPAVAAASPKTKLTPGAWDGGDVEVIQFLAFGDTFVHAVLQPALLMGADFATLPSRFVVNDLLLLGNEKFSSGPPHAIWANELLKRVAVDSARYFLCLSSPGSKPVRISPSQIHHRISQKLCAEIGVPLAALLHDLSSAESNPPGESRYEGPLNRICKAAEQMGRHLEAETFSLSKAGRTWRDMAVQLIGFWGGDRNSQRQKYSDEVISALSVVASCAFPLMPAFAARLWKALGVKSALEKHPWGEPVRDLKPAKITPPAEPLLQSLEDRPIEEFLPTVFAGRRDIA